MWAQKKLRKAKKKPNLLDETNFILTNVGTNNCNNITDKSRPQLIQVKLHSFKLVH